MMMKTIIASAVLWAVGVGAFLTVVTPWGSWDNWAYLYQSHWNILGESCFMLAFTLWLIGFYEWWRLERKSLGWREMGVLVAPAAVLFSLALVNEFATMFWCLHDGHTCHSREFIDGEIEKKLLSVGLCCAGALWACIQLIMQCVTAPAKRKEFLPTFLWWALPLALLSVISFVAYENALYLDDHMGEHWKYAIYPAYVWMAWPVLMFLMLAAYWVRWLNAEKGWLRPIFTRPILSLWSLLFLLYFLDAIK